MFKNVFSHELVLFSHLYMESRGMDKKTKKRDIIKRKGQLYFGSPREQLRTTLLLLHRLLTFSFSPTTKLFPAFPFFFLFFSFFSQIFSYTIHTAPHNSTLSFYSSNEYVGHVCGIQVHIASNFPVTQAYCHQRPNSWVSNFLAKSSCCPVLHRSCYLFWFCVIIYCLQCELCSFKE